MRAFENLLVPGSTDLPECRCGAEMHLFQTKPRGDTEVRVYRCVACQHEFQLMVWADNVERQQHHADNL